MIRIAIVDDQPLLRAGFSMIVQSEEDLELVGEASTGIEAIELAARTRPDVMLMDIRMPDLDGIKATERIVTEPNPPAILVLTTFDSDEYVYGALRAGASGFLLKDAPADDLIHAIRVIAKGEGLLAPSITRRLINDFATRSETKTHPGIAELTEREIEVLLLMSKGMSNSEIAESLYLGETTIKTHVGRILLKLSVRDRVQAVVAAYECGLVQPGS